MTMPQPDKIEFTKLPAVAGGKPGGLLRAGMLLIVLGAAVIGLRLDAGIVAGLQLLPGFVVQGADRLEPFGHGFGGVILILTAVFAAGLTFRQAGMLALSSYGSGMSANLIKLLVVRRRPGTLLPGEVPEFPRLSFLPDDRLPEFSERVISSSLQSFPSAHTAAAFGLAVALGALFPQCRRWWLCLAAGCGLQRILALRHFPSDVLIGAGIGVIVGSVVVQRLQLAVSSDESATGCGIFRWRALGDSEGQRQAA